MAREESEREDILREATALVERAELLLEGAAEPLVFGFRANGALSVFVTQDEVYHFDAEGSWRRGYWSGRLLKAEGGRIVEMIRERTSDQTVLRSRPWSPSEQAEYAAQWIQRREWLRESLDASRYQPIGAVSASGTDPVRRLSDWLEQKKAGPLFVADRPHVR